MVSGLPLRVYFDTDSLDIAHEKVTRLAEELEHTRQLVLSVTEHVHHLEAEEQMITPSAAVYAFLGWLMSQEPAVTLGKAVMDTGRAMQLATEFCHFQGWPMPPEGFSEHLKPWWDITEFEA